MDVQEPQKLLRWFANKKITRFVGNDQKERLKHKRNEPRTKIGAHNLITQLSGVKIIAKGAETTLDC